MRLALSIVLAMAALSGCANSAAYFSLEEYGQGWQLWVEEKGETFRASWVKGDDRSAKLVNIQDAKQGGYIVINTLYLQVAADGTIQRGMLKRTATPDFSQRAYYERRAEWFRVLSGTCVLDAEGNGELDLKCEGYEFKGTVVPDEKMEVITPE